MIKKILHTKTLQSSSNLYLYALSYIYLRVLAGMLRVLGLRQKSTLNNSINLNPNIYQVDIVQA